MSKNLYIYITNEDELAKVAGISQFQPALSLSKENGFFLLPSKELKVDLSVDCNPDAILVYDFRENEFLTEKGKQLCSELLKIANKYGKIYIVHHHQGLQQTHVETSNCKIKPEWRKTTHLLNNSLYQTALDFINANGDDTKIKVAAKNALEAFEGFPELKAKLNALHKALTPDGAKKITDSDLIDPTKENKEALNSFKKKLSGVNAPITQEFTEALKILRNSWLQSPVRI